MSESVPLLRNQLPRFEQFEFWTPFLNSFEKKTQFEVADNVLSRDRLSSFRNIDVQEYTQGVHWNLFELTPLNIQLKVLQ